MKYLGIIALGIGIAGCSPAPSNPVVPLADGVPAEFDVRHMSNMGFKVQSAQPSPVAGLYQVMTDQGLVYASADGEYIVSGRLFDITGEEPVNASDVVLNQMRQRDLRAVADSVITYQAPNEKHVVHVFTDSSCGYCRQLHERMDDYLAAGISVRYLAWPRNGMQGQAAQDLQAAWCADDQQAALTAIKNDQTLPEANCDNPVADHLALGHKFGVRGTPAIVLESGRMIPGYLPPQQLLREIQKTDE